MLMVNGEIRFLMITVNSALRSAPLILEERVGSEDTWAAPDGPGAEMQAELSCELS